MGTPFNLSVETSVGAAQRADDSPALRAPDWEGSGCGGKWLSGYSELGSEGFSPWQARWDLRTGDRWQEMAWNGFGGDGMMGDEAFCQRFVAKSWTNIHRVPPEVMNRIWGSTSFRLKTFYPESLWGCLHCYELNVVSHCSLLTVGTPPRNKGELQHLQRRLRRWWDEFALPTGSRALILKFQPVEIWLQRPGWCFDHVHMYTYYT